MVLGVLSVFRGVLSFSGFAASVLGLAVSVFGFSVSVFGVAVCAVAVFGLLSVCAVFSRAAGFASELVLLRSEVAPAFVCSALRSEADECAGVLVLLAAVPPVGFSPRAFSAAPLPVAPL